MKRTAVIVLLVGLASCAPPYVWGDENRVEGRLLSIVPLGSLPARLEETAKRRGWDLDHRNIQSWPVGTKTYLDDTHRDCRSRGGPVVPTIVAHYYAPLETHVEALWLFDPGERLADICVRKTVDGL